jgi:hypothetical protein
VKNVIHHSFFSHFQHSLIFPALVFRWSGEK